MRKLLYILLISVLTALPAFSQVTNITASGIKQDVSGALLPSGKICFTPVLNGQPSGFTENASGQVLPKQACFAVTNGAVSDVSVADTALAAPSGIGYKVTIEDANGFPIYNYPQPIYPTGTNWSLDAWSPTQSVIVTTPAINFASQAPQGRCGTAPSITYTASAVYVCENQIWQLLPGNGGGGGSGSAFTGGTLTSPLTLAGDPTSPLGAATKQYVDAHGGSSSTGSQRVIYTSQLLGTVGDANVAPGSSATGLTDRAPAINTALSSGNVRLVVDGQYALGSHLTLHSQTSIECLPGMGFIMLPAAGDRMFQNADLAAPTTASGTGGFLVSNIVDHDISVDPAGNCIFNLNSTQAETGDGSHKTAPGSPLWITGSYFFGVRNLTVGGHWYDSPTFTVFYSNVEHGRFSNNWIEAPGVNGGKNNDGVHAIGPAHDILVTNTRCTNLGDDCVAFNADDGNEASLGDGNFSAAQWPNLKWGPITESTIEHTLLENSVTGIRLLSATERIDRVRINDTRGTTLAQTFTLSHEYAPMGNYGDIRIDGVYATTTGAYNNQRHATYWIGGNYDALHIANDAEGKNQTAYPLWNLIDGTIKSFSIENLTISNAFGADATFTAASSTATVNNLRINGVDWSDCSSCTGTLLAGHAPVNLTASNCAIPNRLIPSTGYSPANKNGDCFTNTYASSFGTVYVNTTFGESTAGTLLAGTTPAVNAGSGWVQSSGGPSSGGWSYAGSNTAQISGGCTAGGPDVYCPLVINPGHNNYVMRVNVTQMGGNGNNAINFVFRWTDQNNFSTILPAGGGAWQLCDVVAGATSCGLAQGGGLVNTPGIYTIAVNGTSVTMTTPNSTFSGNISTSNTSNLVGLNENISTSFSPPTIISSFEVSSQ